MFYLVGISVQSDISLVIFIKDDTDGTIEAISKADLKFALRNGVSVAGVSIVDGKENFEATYIEQDVYLLNDVETSAIQKICQLEKTALEPIVMEYTHFQDNSTGELFKITEGLKKLDQARQTYGFSIESFSLTEEETESINKLSKLFGVGLNSSNTSNDLMVAGLDGFEGLDSLDSLDTLDSNTDEYGLSTETTEDTTETPDEIEVVDTTDETEEETVVSKLYAQLDDDQNAILRRYYLWYSQRVFELAGLKGKNTNIHQNTKRMKTKRDAIAKLKKTGGTWMYAGFIDAGREGKKCCEFGHLIDKDKDVCPEGHPVYLDARCEFKHPLRYMHIAWNVEKMDLEQAFFGNRYDKRIEQVLHDNKDTAIIFGIACIGDFFDIDPSYKNMLMTTQRNTLKDMEQIYKYYAEGTTADVLNSFTVMDDFMNYVKKNLVQSNLFGKPSVLDAGTTQFYLQCRNAGLIPPKSLVQMVRDSIIGWDINSSRGHKFTGGLGSVDKPFFIKVMNTIFHAEFNDLLELAYMEHPYDLLVGRADNEIATSYTENQTLVGKLKNYLDIYFKYEICGDFYKYRADDTSKDEGGASVGVRRELKYAYACKDYLWKDLEFSIDYLRKINNLYKLRSSLNMSDCLKTVYQLSYDSDTNRYKIDFNSVRIDYGLIQKYSQQNDSTLAQAVANLANGHRGRIEGLSFYNRNYIPYNRHTIDEVITLTQEAMDVIKAEHTAYTTWAMEDLNRRCTEKNKILEEQEEQKKAAELTKQQEELQKEQEKVNQIEELKTREAKRLSNVELIEVLKTADRTALSEKQQSILDTALNWRGGLDSLTPAMKYRLVEMFNQLYHPDTTPAQPTNAITDLKDDTKMKEALEYAIANKKEFENQKDISDFGLNTIAYSVLRSGHYSEKQKRFIAPILARYEELGK